MTPAQSIGMGLVLVLLDIRFEQWDAIPDVLGWVLVIGGVVRLRGLLETGWLLGLAGVAGAISVPLVDGSVAESLPPSTGWLLSLPEVVFSILLTTGLARLLAEERPDLARRFRGLRWAFVVVAIGPVLLFGGGLDLVLVPLAVLAVGSYVYLVLQVFRASAPIEALRQVRRD